MVTHVKDLKIDLGCSVSLGDVLKVCVYKTYMWRGDINYILHIVDHIVYVIYYIYYILCLYVLGDVLQVRPDFVAIYVYVYMC